MAKRIFECVGDVLSVVALFAAIFGFLIYWKSEMRTLNSGEYGVLINNLPPALGGGYSDTLVLPGEAQVVFPWQTLYSVDTRSKTIYWGGSPNEPVRPFLTATTLDGRTVELTCELMYQVDPGQVLPIVKNFGPENSTRIPLFLKPIAEKAIAESVANSTLSNLQNRVHRNKIIATVKDRIATSVALDGLNLESFFCSEFESDKDAAA